MLDAKGIMLGSPTLNNGMFPTMGDFLTYMKGLRTKGKVFALFGSHGWGGGALKAMRRALEEEKFEIWEKELSVQFLPGRNVRKGVCGEALSTSTLIAIGRSHRGKNVQSHRHGPFDAPEECGSDGFARWCGGCQKSGLWRYDEAFHQGGRRPDR